MERRLAVRAIIFKDGKLLCARIDNRITQRVNDYWCGIGGGVEKHESLLDAMHREIVEETGVVPVLGDLLYVQQFTADGREHLEFFFNVTNSDDFDEVNLEETTHGATELFELDFVDPKNVKLLPRFLVETDIAADIALGKPKFFNYLAAAK